MRYHYLIVVILTLSLFVGLGPRASAAPRGHSVYMPPAPQDIYCLQGRVWGYPGNCQFSTYGQCVAARRARTPIAV